MADFLRGHNPVDADSGTRKEQIMQQIKTELALAQAQELMSKASEKCFNKCVPKPGSSLSASEQTCLSRCLDRYMDAFNIVSKTYVAKLNKTVGGVDNIFN